MNWNDRLKEEIPLEDRARFLMDLQALIASIRGERVPTVTDFLRDHAELALAYMDEGDRKNRAAAALRKP